MDSRKIWQLLGEFHLGKFLLDNGYVTIMWVVSFLGCFQAIFNRAESLALKDSSPAVFFLNLGFIFLPCANVVYVFWK